MKTVSDTFFLLMAFAVGPAVLSSAAPVRACTILVLTDASHALFCNNEDHPNPKTEIWFQPAGDGYYGAVYVGCDSGWAQGGLNTEGLAFDWVAGTRETWEPDPRLPRPRGNASQRMIETCTTVDDGVDFFRTHQEPGFSYARILVADRTGASVRIGAKDGRLLVEKENQSRGFGFGGQTLEKAIAKRPEPTVTNAFQILRDCRQGGDYATKYSNVFDLKSGDVFLYFLPGCNDQVGLNLAVEVKGGAHYYDLPQIRKQRSQPARLLPLTMKRFPLDDAKSIADREPEVTAHLRAGIQAGEAGNSRAEDFTPEMWRRISPLGKATEAHRRPFGDFISMTLVARDDEPGRRGYYYRTEFTHATALQYFVLDEQNRIATGNLWVDVVWKPGASGEAH
jgi:hypothetical protein